MRSRAASAFLAEAARVASVVGVVGVVGAGLGLGLGGCRRLVLPQLGVDDGSAVTDLAAVDQGSAQGGDLAAPSCDPTGALGPVSGVSDDAGDDAAILGQWKYAAGCGTGDALYQIVAGCSALTFSSVIITDSAYGNPPYGLLTLVSDGTFTRTTHAGIVAQGSLPMSCVSGAGSCTVYAHDLMVQYDWLDEAQCAVGATGGCDCSFKAQGSVTDSGSFAASGDELTMQGQSGGPQEYAFATDGTKLTMRAEANTTRGSRGITFVLTR